MAEKGLGQPFCTYRTAYEPLTTGLKSWLVSPPIATVVSVYHWLPDTAEEIRLSPFSVITGAGRSAAIATDTPAADGEDTPLMVAETEYVPGPLICNVSLFPSDIDDDPL